MNPLYLIGIDKRRLFKLFINNIDLNNARCIVGNLDKYTSIDDILMKMISNGFDIVNELARFNFLTMLLNTDELFEGVNCKLLDNLLEDNMPYIINQVYENNDILTTKDLCENLFDFMVDNKDSIDEKQYQILYFIVAYIMFPKTNVLYLEPLKNIILNRFI